MQSTCRIVRRFLLTAALSSAAAAQVNVQWLQPSNGNWFDPLNWQQLGTNPPIHVVPNGPLDSAFINTPESSVVTLDSAVTLDRFTLTAPNTLLGGGSLTTRTFDHTGMISGGVRVDVTEEFSTWTGLLHSATLSLSGRASGFLILPMNAGTNTAVIELNDRVSIDGFYLRQGLFQVLPDDALMSNHGTLTAMGTASFTNTPFYNASDATVIANADFSMHNGVRGGGTFIANAGARLLISGTAELSPQTTVTGDGTIILGVDRMRFPVTAAAVEIPSANGAIEQDVIAKNYLGMFSSGGTLTGGRVVLEAGGVGHVGGTGSLDVSHVSNFELVNRGALNFTGGLQTVANVSITNDSEISLHGRFLFPESGGVAARVQNNGDFRSYDNSRCDWVVQNSGTIVVESGSLSLNGGLTGGLIRVAQGARLIVANRFAPNATYFVGSTIECAGDMDAKAWSTDMRIASPLAIAGRLRVDTTQFFKNVRFDGDVSAATIEGGGGIFDGRVTASRVEGYYVFNQPVAADFINCIDSTFNESLQAEVVASSRTAFNGLNYELEQIEFGSGNSIKHDFIVTGTATLHGHIEVDGLMHIQGPATGSVLENRGIGTMIIDGPVSLQSNSSTTPNCSVSNGILIARHDIGAGARPSFEIIGSNARAYFESSQHFRETRLAAGSIFFAPSGQSVFSFRTLPSSTAIGSQIDLADNTLIADYTASTPFLDIAGDIFTGYANGAWNGPAIYSSVAGGNSEVGIGVAEASAIFSSFPATIAGETVDSTTVIARYTLRGDANLDRTVDIRDFSLLAARFNTTGFWHHGDFNYDFTVNLADFAIMAANFNRTMSFADGLRGAAVPEPALAVVGLLVAISLRRRWGPYVLMRTIARSKNGPLEYQQTLPSLYLLLQLL